MTRVLLDTNVYDALRAYPEAVTRIRSLCERGLLTIIATSTIRDELSQSPMGGIPGWFPVSVDLDAIAVIGHSRIGHARIGRNDIYDRHRGQSRQVPDAVIAESAERYADIFVSDDVRCRDRFAQMTQNCKVMGSLEFVQWLNTSVLSDDAV
jgi:predicted nucleic acid-binding protein